MKNRHKVFVFYTLCAIGIIQPRTPHVIVITLKNYPHIDDTKAERRDVTRKKTISAALPLEPKSTALSWSINSFHTQGIYSTYFGYLALSNNAGQIIFPRNQQDTAFTLIVTQHIKPIFMLHNTINTWRIPQGTQYAAFSIERIKDAKTGLYVWNVEKTTLPKNRSLPLDAITIFAQPDELYIPLGISVTENTPQLSFPPFFVKKDIKLPENALFVLNYRQFFESLERSFKTQGSDVQSKFAIFNP